ncbi:MAG TPA: hypothetical protein VH256_06655 [Thermoleophilaceae bacterium]|jgi:hypothetical protein|nr:hypothetical protein [Thermoleophilaceae bacterium]
MFAREIVVEVDGATSVLSGRIELEGGEPFELEYRFEGVEPGDVRASGDPFLAALLAPAMARGEDLEIDAPLSPRLRAASATIQDIYAAWAEGAERVRISAPALEAPGTPGAGNGQLFTGGVDSYYSMLRGGPKSHFLFAQGFDISLADNAGFAKAAEHVRYAAREVGAVPVLVRTNLRDFSDAHVHWEIYHGAALATLGLALQGVLGRLVIPSSWSYANLRPYGTHPLLDPLWSTEGLEVVHDGCEARRFEKVAAISGSDLAVENLRVCFTIPADGLNCGRCQKCVSTLAFLSAAGAADRAASFPPGFTPERLRRTRLSNPAVVQTLADLLASLRERGETGEFVQALDYALHPPLWRRALRYARYLMRKWTP